MKIQRLPRTSSRRRLEWGVGVMLLLLIVSCNGGSNSLTGLSYPSVSSVEAESFQLLNHARLVQGHGLKPLVLNAELTKLARQHSERMRDLHYFSHTDPVTGYFTDRLRAAHVVFIDAGENIARVTGSSDPAGVAHDQFMSHADHRANILSPLFTEVGVGAARSGSTYWITQLFIRP